MSKQQGAAALPISVMLLFVATLILIIVSRTTLMEQRISGNEIRAIQAHQAAQAGVDHALAYMQGYGNGRGIDRVLPYDQADIISQTPGVLENQASYIVWYCDPITNPPADTCSSSPPTVPPTCGTNFTNRDNFPIPLIFSCGWSDDGLARKNIVVSVSSVPSLPVGNVEYPLISGGAVTLSGSATVANYYDDRIILSGGDYDAHSSAGHLYLRSPLTHAAPTREQLEAPDKNDCGILTPTDTACSKPYYSLQADEQNIYSVGKLKDLDNNANFFERVFCMDFDTYTQSMPLDRTPPLRADTLDGIKGEVVVLSGNQTIGGGNIGTPEQPVVIIIDGDLELSGNPKIYGVVYVRGNVTRATGTATIVGSLISEKPLDFGAGSISLIYDPETISNASNLGLPGVVSGSWRDWL